MAFDVKGRKKSVRGGVRHTPPVFWYNAICGMVACALLCCCFSCKVTADDPSHYISYYCNGGTWYGFYTPPMEVEQAVTLPGEYQIVRTGYTFAGWYDNETLTGNPITGWNAGDKNADITLWAKWISSDKSISSFTFTADTNTALKNDAEGTINKTDHTIAVRVPYGTDISALKATFTIVDTSSVVVGSVAQTSGETVNDFTNPVTYTVTAEDGTSQRYTVTVTIGIDEYNISYNQNGGAWSSGYTVLSSYKTNETVILPTAANIVHTKYTLAGWYDNEALTGTAVTGWNAGGKNADITLWAKWIAVATLDGQGATTAGTESVTATSGAALPAITPPTRDGYTFAGYWTEKDGKGTQYYNADGSGTAGKTWDITENITLYAYWTVNASNAATAIAALTSTGSPHTVALTGELSTENISVIKTELETAYIDSVKVALDMSACTGLEALPSEAFKGCKGLTSVTIPDSVKSIGKSAFNACTGLTSVTIPDGVTDIDESAFNACTGLTSVTIPGSVTGIGDSAFYECTRLTSVTIENGVTTIGDDAFYGCNRLTSVTIPNSVTSIGSCAFYKCSSLASVTIPNNVTSIGSCAFGYCTKLTSVEIPGSVKSIVKQTFYSCTGLISVTIPDSVTSIGDDAFYYCSSLTSVTIPKNVTTIGDNAFYDCSSLTSVTIPESVTSIGKRAFFYSALTSLTFSDPKNWYNTLVLSDWENKTVGTKQPVDMTDPSTNAKNFTSYTYYWFKVTD